MNSKLMTGIFLIGASIGLVLPNLPAPLNFLNQWLWIIFAITGIILIIKGM